ncbi:MAG: twin-arginine translocase subunit TatC [Angustibacter sp.]
MSRRRRDPEGRMPLREHLVELRRRVLRSAVVILIGSVVGWFLAEPFLAALIEPAVEVARAKNIESSINYLDPFSALNQRVQISVLIGVFLAAPVWLYQFWAFITPGLTTKERRYSVGFVAAAVPLFAAGAALAWYIFPKAWEFLIQFVPADGSQYLTANLYFSFVTRLLVMFGIAFVIPVVLVGLNMAHLMSGRTMVRQWRIVVFVCFLFAAIATPTPEAMSMLVLAGAMCLLFGTAIGICLLLDRRRARRSGEPDYDALADDEASPL